MSSLLRNAVLGSLVLGTGDASSPPSFALSPLAAHATGVVHVTATFANATASASNSFSVSSGPASGISNYVKVNATTATFDLTITTVSSTPIVIADSVTSTTQNFSAAAVLPGAPTITSATAGNAQATIAFNPPADNGGATITSYTVTASTGQMASGSGSPILVPGLANGIPVVFTVDATNAVGTGPDSASSSAVTPSGPVVSSTIQQIGPFLSTDTLTAPGYEVYSGGGTLINALSTSLANITNVSNGRLAAIPVTLDAFGSFSGYALWQTGQSPNVYAPRELYIPPTDSSGLSTGVVTKVIVFPYGTVMTSPGYQLFQATGSTYTAVGSRTSTGVTAIPNVPTGRSANVTVTLGVDRSFRGIIVWDNGAGVYAPPEEVFIPALLNQPTTTKSLSISVVDRNGTAVANATGIKWAFFDEAEPDLFSRPVDSGAAGAFVSGVFALTVHTASITGQKCTLAFSNSNGSGTQGTAEKATLVTVVMP